MTSEDRVDHVFVRINEKLNNIVPLPKEPCIFRVHHELRNANPKAYDPGMVAIGPYHRGKVELKAMEDHKLRCLQLLLKRSNKNLEPFIDAMRGLEESARQCYREPVGLNSDEFVEMMLLDGVYIVEFCRKMVFREFRDDMADPIFGSDNINYNLRNDMILLENQLPFSVLHELFEMTKHPGEENQLPFSVLHELFEMTKHSGKEKDFVTTAIGSFGPLLKELDSSIEFPTMSVEKPKHILDLIYNMWFSTFAAIDSTEEKKQYSHSISSITELKEAGVQFKKAEGVKLADIKFNDGVMEIPFLMIGDGTETILRNLIAYEQSCDLNHPRYLSDYSMIMDCLINSPKDVEVLRRRGIIDNWLGDDKQISTMFNKLGQGVNVDSCNFRYAEIFNNVNFHCGRRRNVWMANLRHNYFNSPWNLFSFLAAATLLILTLVQTVFAVLSD